MFGYKVVKERHVLIHLFKEIVELVPVVLGARPGDLMAQLFIPLSFKTCQRFIYPRAGSHARLMNQFRQGSDWP